MDKFNDDMLFAINYRLALKKIPIVIDYETEKTKCQFLIPDEVGYLKNPILNPTEKLTDLVTDIFYHLYGKKIEFNPYNNTIFWIKEE